MFKLMDTSQAELDRYTYCLKKCKLILRSFTSKISRRSCRSTVPSVKIISHYNFEVERKPFSFSFLKRCTTNNTVESKFYPIFCQIVNLYSARESLLNKFCLTPLGISSTNLAVYPFLFKETVK